MSPTRQSRAIVYAYDVGTIVNQLEAFVRQLQHRHPTYSHRELTDLWFDYTIHRFEVVSVDSFVDTCHHSDLINSLSTPITSIAQLWSQLKIPPDLSGSQVITRRIEDTLWIFFIRPNI